MAVDLASLARMIERAISQLNDERQYEELAILKTARILLLGQYALMVHPVASKVLQLTMTRDVDALIDADWSQRMVIKRIIEEQGFVYDELSTEVWIPPHATYEVLHESSSLVIQVLNPIYVLTSKAIKAPQKNRFLIQQALAYYGRELADLIELHGGSLSLFE